jgi:hypothetical protein
MQTITVTLQQAYQTNPIGPFDIELRDGSDNIYNTDTGVSLEDFLTGRTYTDQSDLITKVHVTSTGEVCQNTIEFPITVEPTPTPTPAPTTATRGQGEVETVVLRPEAGELCMVSSSVCNQWGWHLSETGGHSVPEVGE